eukprot:476447-Amphidinium_carterae.1
MPNSAHMKGHVLGHCHHTADNISSCTSGNIYHSSPTSPKQTQLKQASVPSKTTLLTTLGQPRLLNPRL